MSCSGLMLIAVVLSLQAIGTGHPCHYIVSPDWLSESLQPRPEFGERRHHPWPFEFHGARDWLSDPGDKAQGKTEPNLAPSFLFPASSSREVHQAPMAINTRYSFPSSPQPYHPKTWPGSRTCSAAPKCYAPSCHVGDRDYQEEGWCSVPLPQTPRASTELHMAPSNSCVKRGMVGMGLPLQQQP